MVPLAWVFFDEEVGFGVELIGLRQARPIPSSSSSSNSSNGSFAF